MTISTSSHIVERAILAPKRVESTDGSASHPYRKIWWGHIAEVPDFLYLSRCVFGMRAPL